MMNSAPIQELIKLTGLNQKGRKKGKRGRSTGKRIDQAFFLTSAIEKIKTQAQNSSQKLKKKTQAPGGITQKSKKKL